MSIAYRACIPARQTYAQTIGLDGTELLIAVWAEASPAYLRQIPAVEILRQTWVHQYFIDQQQVRLRAAADATRQLVVALTPPMTPRLVTATNAV